MDQSLANKSVLLASTALAVAAIVLMVAPEASALRKKDVARMANSPIYYIQTPMLGSSGPGSNGAFSMQSLFLSALKQHHEQKKAARPSTLSVSSLYRLPIRYLSNAKPIDIIAGKKKTSLAPASSTSIASKKRKRPSASKLIYLPLKFRANGKSPSKVMINPFKSF